MSPDDLREFKTAVEVARTENREEHGEITKHLAAQDTRLAEHGRMLAEFMGEVRGLYNGSKSYVDATLLAAKIVTQSEFKIRDKKVDMAWKIGAGAFTLLLTVLLVHLGLK
jgi:hypothetical protein